uniref:Uncharacterized protein n=1 Tax=Cacopsylla melanoneura TaxID=428564 RepID=A0A8D9BGN7_9HEMI
MKKLCEEISSLEKAQQGKLVLICSAFLEAQFIRFPMGWVALYSTSVWVRNFRSKKAHVISNNNPMIKIYTKKNKNEKCSSVKFYCNVLSSLPAHKGFFIFCFDEAMEIFLK